MITITDEAVEQIRRMQGEIERLQTINAELVTAFNRLLISEVKMEDRAETAEAENTRLTEELLSITADRQIAINARDEAREHDAELRHEGGMYQSLYEVSQQRVEELRSQLVKAEEALQEAEQQIEYLHHKFKPTGSGFNVLAKIDMALTAIRRGKVSNPDEKSNEPVESNPPSFDGTTYGDPFQP